MSFSLNKKSFFVFLLIIPSTVCIILALFVFTNLLYTKNPPLTHFINHVDADQLKGDWFIISNIPYFAEKNKVASKASYIKLGDNKFKDVFTSQEKSFQAPVEILTGTAKTLNSSNTQWQSTFYYVIRFNFEVVYINHDYSFMLLAHKSRKYAWIMARSKTVSDSAIVNAMKIFQKNGYDLSKFRLVPQHPEQLKLINKPLNELYNIASL